jgi:hypothetical protein
MTLEQLKKMKAEGQFHHATYRTDFARGLHIYSVAKPGSGFRGFEYAGCFSEVLCTKEEIDAAYDVVRNTGVSVGSYGNG